MALELTPDQSRQSVLVAAWRRRRLVALCGLCGLLLGGLYALVRPRPPQFAAIATIGIQEPGTGESGPFDPSARYVSSQAAIIRSNGVAEQAAELLNAGDSAAPMTVEDLMDHSTVAASPESNLLVVRASSDTADGAVAAVNAIVTAYDQFSRQQYTRTATAAVERLDAQLDALSERFSDLQLEVEKLVSEDQVSAELQAVYNAAVAETTDLLTELTTAGPVRQGEIELRLDVLLQQVDTYRLLVLSGPQDPQLTSYQEEQDQIIQRRAVLLERRDQIAIDAELAPTPIALVSLASAAEAVGEGDLGRFAAAGLMVGFAAGMGTAYLLTAPKLTFASRGEVEAALVAPMLADIPNFGAEGLATNLPVRDSPRSASAEAYRFAAASILRKMEFEGLTSLIAVAALVGHGKSTTVVNVALASAAQGSRVLLVDADFGSQGASSLLVGNSLTHLGLTDALDGRATIDQVVQPIDVGSGQSVFLIGRGLRPAVAAEVLLSDKARQFFEEVRRDFDLVLIDAPPLLQVAYTSGLLAYADAAMVVVPHESPVEELAEMRRRLTVLRTPVFGFIYNQSPLRPEMATNEGSMRDILGDRGLVSSSPSRPRTRFPEDR